jgi:tetratricopeptide (TPR) repeat protein
VDAASALLRGFIEKSHNDEQKAHCHLTLGQIATDEQRFEAAVGHFNAALELKPRPKKITYVLQNNVAYCLNMLGRYIEGERHCRLAVELNGNRASGYRNLGVSLKGQGKIVEALWALVEAAKLDVSDERARVLLRTLIVENPHLTIQCPWAVDGLAPVVTGETSPVN